MFEEILMSFKSREPFIMPSPRISPGMALKQRFYTHSTVTYSYNGPTINDQSHINITPTVPITINYLSYKNPTQIFIYYYYYFLHFFFSTFRACYCIHKLCRINITHIYSPRMRVLSIGFFFLTLNIYFRTTANNFYR